MLPASPELVCVQPDGEWCYLHELKDYQDDGEFLDDYETMSHHCMMNQIVSDTNGRDT